MHRLAGFRTLLFAVLGIVIQQPALTQTYQVIHNFTGAEDGANPAAGLTADNAGNLYGTANSGPLETGTAFKLRKTNGNWIFTLLYTFEGGSDGSGPVSRMVFGPDGTLYGATSRGGTGCLVGCGTVFNLKPTPTICHTAMCAWQETVLYRFSGGSDGSFPANGDLVFDRAGSLYGATGEGGIVESGVVYKLAPSRSGWTESVVYSFTHGNDGGSPNGVIFGQDGNLYGTAFSGGMYSRGTVFQLVSSGMGWSENTLHSFQEDEGFWPSGGLILDGSGGLYGSTTSGGAGGGDVFNLTPVGGSWNLTVLYGFPNGIGPDASLTMDAVGNLYGAEQRGGLYGFGVVFKLTPNIDGMWTYSSMHDFTGIDGAGPLSNVVLDASGRLYGTTYNGGTYNCNGEGCGVVWEITQ
jgi:uncharacterized repeat protein (TIGR03803 family)